MLIYVRRKLMPEFVPQIIMILALFAIMYFMLIRPQKKKDDEVRKMRESLKVGDDILTIGGIYGKIVRIKDDRITLQVGTDRTKIDVAKWAVNNVEKPNGARETAEEKKVTPKNMKKLGDKAETAAEEVAEAVEAAAEDVQE